MSLMNNPLESLGVLQHESVGTPPFTEAAYCRKLALNGQKHHLSVIVFSPATLRPRSKTIKGYTLEGSQWVYREHKLPRLVYDRLSYTNADQYIACRAACNEMKHLGVIWLGNGLRGKWDLYQSLSQDRALSHILPTTSLYESPKQLLHLIQRHQGSLFMKPHGGSQGRSVLSVHRIASSAHADSSSLADATIRLHGRDAQNRPIQREFTNTKDALKWIHQFIAHRKYIIQPYLTLYSHNKQPFDIRVLVQKDERGRWNETGMAARVGDKESVTSNLHGGGHACRTEAFLTEQFGAPEADHLLSQIKYYSQYIPTAIEPRHGRLVELGLDYGIDRDKRLWLLEANSKPGRSVFTHTGDREASTLAVELPILYARYVWVRHLRRVCP